MYPYHRAGADSLSILRPLDGFHNKDEVTKINTFSNRGFSPDLAFIEPPRTRRTPSLKVFLTCTCMQVQVLRTLRASRFRDLNLKKP
jgi:hypothetical protein